MKNNEIQFKKSLIKELDNINSDKAFIKINRAFSNKIKNLFLEKGINETTYNSLLSMYANFNDKCKTLEQQLSKDVDEKKQNVLEGYSFLRKRCITVLDTFAEYDIDKDYNKKKLFSEYKFLQQYRDEIKSIDKTFFTNELEEEFNYGWQKGMSEAVEVAEKYGITKDTIDNFSKESFEKKYKTYEEIDKSDSDFFLMGLRDAYKEIHGKFEDFSKNTDKTKTNIQTHKDFELDR